MPGKRPNPLPTSRRKAAQSALLLAVSVLQDERVREQLRKAPVAAREWAEQRRVIDVTPRTESSGPSAFERLDPTQRFGQKGIERRLTALQRNADLVFADPNDPGAVAVFRAIDELSRAASISATMSMNERRKARSRITAELTRLERALVDAVLPPEPPPRG